MAVPLALGGAVPRPGARWMRWIARAWRRLGWRQIALAPLLAVLTALLAPNGGLILLRGWGLNILIADLLGGRWVAIVPLLFAAMVADEAYRDGVRPVAAYSLALLLGWSAATVMDALGANVFGSWQFNQFRVKFLFVQGSLGMAVYAYWRTTLHTLGRIQRSEADRVRDRQQLLAARLLALQARVEPQFLFDALSRVGEMHERDPQAADALLADLIALLRAMLPVGTAQTSTVAREFALAEAWLRVQRHLGRPLEVEIAASPLAKQSGIGAMLVLPLLQEMQALPRASALAWRLSAELASSGADAADDAGVPRTPRLCVRLAPNVALPAAAGAAAVTPGLERIRERIAELHGGAATLAVATLGGDATAYQLELPFIEETASDADRADR
ncbi:MAG TPA: histidine kinase [Xanthomonadales bacterium]|nr:histidine kinase [Xanthomonadales bacterium]